VNLYVQLLEEMKKKELDYPKLKTLLEDIKSEIEEGKIPTYNDFIIFNEALRIARTKSLILKNELEKTRLEKKVCKTYFSL